MVANNSLFVKLEISFDLFGIKLVCFIHNLVIHAYLNNRFGWHVSRLIHSMIDVDIKKIRPLFSQHIIQIYHSPETLEHPRLKRCPFYCSIHKTRIAILGLLLPRHINLQSVDALDLLEHLKLLVEPLELALVPRWDDVNLEFAEFLQCVLFDSTGIVFVF